MTDRVSANPGRMLITPEDGSAPFYATLSMADNPTVLGTPLNKASLLTDATAALYGLSGSAVPDDVLAKARSLIKTAQNTANSASTSAGNGLKVVTGSYTGDGSGSKTISVSGTPQVLMFSLTNGKSTESPFTNTFIRGQDQNNVTYVNANYTVVSGNTVDISFSSSSITLTSSAITLSGRVYTYMVLYTD